MTTIEKINLLYRNQFGANSQLLFRDTLLELANLQVKTIEGDYVISNDDLGCCIQCLSSNPVTIVIPENLVKGIFFTVERLGEGALSVEGAGTSINGEADEIININDQWSSVYIRSYEIDFYKAEGNFS